MSGPELLEHAPADPNARQQRIDLSLVVPTYNERANIAELITRVERALEGFQWELIFVDDDSPDRTAELVRGFARLDRRIRLIHRIGRRGLSTACIEGTLSSSSNYIAIMDGDLQHDETILPRMLQSLRSGSLDLVVGTRNAEGGSMGQFDHKRVLLSRMGQRISGAVCQCQITDPMSGYFLFTRDFFLEVVHQLHGGGFKILLDMLACAERPVRLAEVGYTFRKRIHGESKLDLNTGVEYLMLIVDKLTGGALPVRFTSFALVGIAGLATHLICLTVLVRAMHLQFVSAQIAATYLAMTENFFLNNVVTWRDRRLKGIRLFTGLTSFWLACSFGAWANVLFARSLLLSGMGWLYAGVAGIVISSVWNYSMSNLFVWQARCTHRAQEHQPLEPAAFDPSPTGRT